MTTWEPQFVEPTGPLLDPRQIQYREISIWRDLRDGYLYQFLCIERTPPGDFFIALCVAWKELVGTRLESEYVPWHLRRGLLHFTKLGGPTYPTVEAAIAAYDLTQAEKF
jgi:hypothetical protein